MRALLIGLAGVAAICGAAHALKTASPFDHEGWKGFALLDESNFIQCQMSMSAINNYDLMLSLNPDGELRLGFRSHKIDNGFAVLFKQKFAARIQLDGGPVLVKAFEAKTQTSLSTSLKGTDWEAKLPNASVLRINDGRMHLFHLNGIKEAMAKLRACVAKYRTA